ncbi:MAG: hypothetical protein ABR962_11645 [Candidatus Bathyarchaeia archaeon]
MICYGQGSFTSSHFAASLLIARTLAPASALPTHPGLQALQLLDKTEHKASAD